MEGRRGGTEWPPRGLGWGGCFVFLSRRNMHVFRRGEECFEKMLILEDPRWLPLLPRHSSPIWHSSLALPHSAPLQAHGTPGRQPSPRAFPHRNGPLAQVADHGSAVQLPRSSSSTAPVSLPGSRRLLNYWPELLYAPLPPPTCARHGGGARR